MKFLRFFRCGSNLSNAIKYIGNGARKEITASLTASETHATLVIEDTGIGIAEANLPHLFKRFYRVQHTKEQNKKGTGLGLAITKAIVERFGGTIEVNSTLGRGTTFIISLPRAMANAATSS